MCHAGRNVAATVTAQYPGRVGLGGMAQHAHECAARGGIEPIQRFIEQKHVGPSNQRPCQQHTTTLAVGKREKAARREPCEPHALERREHGLLLACTRRLQRDVGLEQTRRDHVEHRQVPFVALVTILPLGPEVRNAIACQRRLLETIAAEDIRAALTPRRRRPHVAAQQLQQHRLAGAVRPGQQPVLAAPQVEGEPSHGQVPAIAHADPFELDALQARAAPPADTHGPSHVQVSPLRAARPSSWSLMACARSEYFASRCRCTGVSS